MKAMVVFEVDDLDDVVVYANVYKREQGWKRQIGRLECVKPVPLPMKRETMVHWKSIGGGDIPTHEITDYDKGWNDCVEFLEGEEYADK